MNKNTDTFGSMVFSKAVMKDSLPAGVFESVMESVELSRPLNENIAAEVAEAMKNWAISKGATHYTHWFQPMTGITAEKHDSFIYPKDDGTAINKFSSSALINGETDASSFPSGGLRATCEARGYTAWDPTSYAFIKENTLCIPTVFYSYGGEALDKKTPLLRSMDSLNTQALRVLRLFGNNARRVYPDVGAEQEYFLVDKSMYSRRKDLIITGRTLFGTRPPKGQDLDDHYFGAINPRVSAFMRELDEELWKLGVPAKTEHNEAAPSQHELACVYRTANTATDHNQLVMEMMKTVADRHGFVCLLHEKPFLGVNGSGKHNNWSISTDTGTNLLEPGSSPAENAQFLLFLCAVIKAVDEHQDLLRLSVATAGNDCRLGGNEAPPAILSMSLGDELSAILDAIEQGKTYDAREREPLEIGVDVLPSFPKDTSDRNRTSPFAFTGNKFEFRMPGSSLSIAGPNFIINTIVAESLRQYADELEAADDFTAALNRLIRRTIKKHKRIIFNGNNYTDEWREEAARRGLLILPTSADALPLFADEKNIELFERHKVLSAAEIRSRQEIMLQNYCKAVRIEALTMIELARRDVLPACIAFSGKLANTLSLKVSLPSRPACRAEEKLLGLVSSLCDSFSELTDKLQQAVDAMPEDDLFALSACCRDSVLPAMEALREVGDKLEANVSVKYWPYPTYGKLLYTI